LLQEILKIYKQHSKCLDMILNNIDFYDEFLDQVIIKSSIDIFLNRIVFIFDKYKDCYQHSLIYFEVLRNNKIINNIISRDRYDIIKSIIFFKLFVYTIYRKKIY
jgi:hypothetical protein